MTVFALRRMTGLALRRMTVLVRLMTVVVLPLSLFTSIVHAESNNAGTKNGNFLKIQTDARGVALGDTSVSMGRGADALRANPAGLGVLDTHDFSGTHVQYYQGVQMENVAAAIPFDNSGLAVSVFYLSAGDVEGRDSLGSFTGNFKYYDMAGTVGYGRRFLNRAEGNTVDLSVGAGLKLVREVIDNQSFQNPALDLGVLMTPIDDLNLGAVVRDFSSGSANFSREIIGGVSYTAFRNFTGAVALNSANDAPTRYSVSGEYRFPEAYDAVLRAGYHSHDDLDDSTDSQIKAFRGAGIAGLTMGAGFEYPIPTIQNLKLGVDYAMAPFGALGISHTITLHARW